MTRSAVRVVAAASRHCRYRDESDTDVMTLSLPRRPEDISLPATASTDTRSPVARVVRVLGWALFVVVALVASPGVNLLAVFAASWAESVVPPVLTYGLVVGAALVVLGVAWWADR